MAKRTTTSGMTKPDQAIFAKLQQFAASVTTNFKAFTAGEPEAQLACPPPQHFLQF